MLNLGLEYQEIFGTEASFLNSKIFKIPIRSFVPDGIVQVTCEGKNLRYLNCRNNKIIGGAISFDLKDAIQGSLGEFVERYSAAFWDNKTLIIQSYNSIKEQNNIKVLPFEYIKPYSDWQYGGKFPYSKLLKSDEIAWVKCKNIKSDENIYVPAFMVYMPFEEEKTDKLFMQYTSTGLSTNNSVEKAIIGGFLECAERHAFTNFWYNQKNISFIKYNAETILKKYPENNQIQKLFNNNLIRISIFDLTNFSQIETIIVFIHFEYKGKLMQSMGSSSRFKKEDALIKAMLEAYQGVEYSLLVDKKDWKDHNNNLEKVNDYDKHFAFYNNFPELRATCLLPKQYQYL